MSCMDERREIVYNTDRRNQEAHRQHSMQVPEHLLKGSVMDRQKINRINELYRKSKAEGLTDAEKKEQKILRMEYIESVKRNLLGQLNNIDIEEKDGTVVNLGEKYGKKTNAKKGN